MFRHFQRSFLYGVTISNNINRETKRIRTKLVDSGTSELRMQSETYVLFKFLEDKFHTYDPRNLYKNKVEKSHVGGLRNEILN